MSGEIIGNNNEKIDILTQRDHVLKNSSYYFGCDIENITNKIWLYDGNKFTYEKTKYNPGIIKMIRELYENSIDYYFKLKSSKNPNKMTEINISIKEKYFSVYNNGSGIPTGKIDFDGNRKWNTELIYLHIGTGSNNNESSGIGKNSIGSKICNYTSEKFIVDIVDEIKKRNFYHVFKLSKPEKPIITKDDKIESGSTRIKVYPILKHFNLKKIDVETTSNIIRFKLLELVTFLEYFKGYKPVIKLNGSEIIPMKSQEFLNIIYPKNEMYNFKISEGKFFLDIFIIPGQNNYLSFINGASISNGTHIKKIKKSVEKIIKEKYKITKMNGIKLGYYIFGKINRVKFDSQNKENLISKLSDFGFKIEIKPNKRLEILKFLESYISDILEVKLDKKTKDKLNKVKLSPEIMKMYDPPEKRGKNNVLILVEGNSASGPFDRNKKPSYGIFRLKGKPLNVSNGTDVLLKSETLRALISIAGLKIDSKPDKLGFNEFWLAMDQDVDGEHIRGLVLNIFKFWPDLFKSGKIKFFDTPLIIATKKGKKSIYFKSEEEYKKSNLKGYTCDYLKGLGSSTKEQFKEYFNRLDEILITVKAGNFDQLNLAFDKSINGANRRKLWLSETKIKDKFYEKDGSILVNNFIDNRFINFSRYDILRSLPNLDGFKPSQQKIITTAFGLNTKKKVSEFAGEVSLKMAYHHGQQSLEGAIILMSQDFPGSNNLPIFKNEGEFGSRINFNSAAPRYIKVGPIDYFDNIFHPLDKPILEYNYDENKKIEARNLMPIIPMGLINGCCGIGTGYANNIPAHDPLEIIKYIMDKIKGLTPDKLYPSYINYDGNISIDNDIAYSYLGEIEKINDKKYHITEIPPIISYYSWKEKIIKKFADILNGPPIKKGDSMDIIINFTEEPQLKTNDLISEFYLESPIKKNYTFTDNGIPIVYKTKYNYLDEYFIPTRIKFYDNRRNYWVKKYKDEINYLTYKIKFIENHKEMGEIIRKNNLENAIEKIEEKLNCDIPDIINKILDSINFKNLLKINVDTINDKIKELEEKIKSFNKTNEELYLTDLRLLRKKIKKLYS